jgi:predicted aldo/keto reductase-like oxidoreductase
MRQYLDFILHNYWEDYANQEAILRYIVSLISGTAIVLLVFGFHDSLFEFLTILTSMVLDFTFLSITYFWTKL